MKNIKQFKDVKTDVIVKLSHLGIIKLTGADAQQFLQNQFTNDVIKVDAEHNQLSAWCNHKGRIIVSFRLFKRQDSFYLLLPQESLAPIIKRLQMYVLRSVVQLEDVTNNLICIGISGNNSQTTVTDCLFEPPTAIDTSLTVDATTVLRIAGTIPRYIIISETMPDCFQTISKNTQAWQLLDIIAGLPTIGLATTEEFVPQMVNYQLINGISFNKGCYPGQEVVARLHYLGKLKRKLNLAEIETDKTPQSGDNVEVNGEKVGKIVNVALLSEGNVVVLVSVIVKHAESN
ncbi:MAG: folate-binding protein YgfZ, partial [Proteobacteria bacterium]|nr:folate-binding protein YgfZ [Pseudomonadota bacterium]